MILKQLTLKFFKSFKELILQFNEKINIITGENLDNSSSNGAGKSSLLEGLIFAVFGCSSTKGVNLVKLPQKPKKGCSANCILVKQGNKWDIGRSLPTKLELKVNNEDSKLIGLTQKQNAINKEFGNYDYFKKFRMFDLGKGTNILEFGNVSLKKTLMNFLENIFEDIRDKLGKEKRTREEFNINKKVYKYYPSEKRLNKLQEGLEQIILDTDYLNSSDEEVRKEYNEAAGDIKYLEKNNYRLENEKKKLNFTICPTCKTEITEDKRNDLFLDKEMEIMNNKNKIMKLDKTFKDSWWKLGKNKNKIKLLSDKRWKLQELITKLSSNLKFKDYKYSDSDVLLYKEAIKTIDNFAAYYLKSWVEEIETIINSFIFKIDMLIKFELNNGNLKLKVTRENATLDYDELSGGEKIFLSAIFKLAILMQQGESGLILVDEGVDRLCIKNILRLIEIIKQLPFQLIIISQQHLEVPEANYIHIIKEKGISKIAK